MSTMTENQRQAKVVVELTKIIRDVAKFIAESSDAHQDIVANTGKPDHSTLFAIENAQSDLKALTELLFAHARGHLKYTRSLYTHSLTLEMRAILMDEAPTFVSFMTA